MASAGRLRRWVLRPAIWALVALALLIALARLFLASDFARERVRDLLAAQLSEALARPVAIAAVDFELLPLGLIVEGLTLASDRPGEPPLATVRRLTIEGDLEGFRRSELVLTWVAIEGLDLHLEFREDGTDNLPRPRRRGAPARELALRIDGLEISGSQVTVAERKAPVDVRARAVAARLVGLGRTDLVGSVVAQQVELGLPKARPLPLALAAKAKLRSDRLEILSARVSGPELTAQVAGRIGWRQATRVELAGRVEASGALVDRLGYLDGEIAGPIGFDGSFEWRREAWGFRGEVESAGLDLFGFRLDDVAGQVAGEQRTMRFDLAHGRFAGGAAAGSFTVDLEPGRYPASLDLTLAGADLEQVLARFSVPIAGLAGEVSGPFRYDFDLLDAARGSGAGEFTILPRLEPGKRVAATGSALLRLEEGRVELPAIELATPGQRVTASGGYALDEGRGRFGLEAQSEDLGELMRLLPFAEAGSLWQPTAGTGLIAGTIEIVPRGFAAELDLACAGVEAPGFAAARLTGSVRATERAVEALELELEQPGARLVLSGRLPYAAGSAEQAAAGLDLRLRAEGWPVESARPWLPFELPFEGPVRGTLTLAGALDAITGRIDAGVAPAWLAGVGVDRLAVALAWDGERVDVARFTLAAPAGELEGRGTLRLADSALDFAARSPALDLAAAPFATWTAGRLGGRLGVDVKLGGTLERPAIELDGALDGLAVAGEAPGEGAPGRLEASWSEGRLELAADLPDLLRVEGAGPWTLDGGAELALEVSSERLDRLAALAAGAPVAGLEGEVAGRVVARLPAAGGSAAALELEIPALAFRYGGRELTSLEPVRARLDAGGLHLDSLYLGLPGGADELFVAGDVRLEDDPALDLKVQASLAISWLEPALAGLDLAGRVDGLAVVRGTLAHPAVSGQVEWSGGRWIPPRVPHTLEHARALLLLYPDALVVDHLAADFAGGQLLATGRVELGAEPSYRFEATARRVAVRWPAGWQLRGDGDFTLVSTAEGRQLRGELRLDRIFYPQDVKLSAAQLLQRVLTRTRLEVSETDDLLSTTYLALAVRARNAVRIRNNVANLSGGGDLTVRGTLARPVAFGEIAFEPGGTVEYAGNRYQLERALVTFANPARIEPLLDVVARSRVDQYDVTVRLGGTLERLETQFASDPPLPDLDVLALLSTGAPLETRTAAGSGELASGGAGSSSQAAEQVLYGQASSLLTERVSRLFGFDKLRVDPLTTGDAISSARVTVGKRISSDLYVTYSVDPSSTAQQILQVEWRLTDRMVLVLTQNGNESYSVDARWESGF